MNDEKQFFWDGNFTKPENWTKLILSKKNIFQRNRRRNRTLFLKHLINILKKRTLNQYFKRRKKIDGCRLQSDPTVIRRKAYTFCCLIKLLINDVHTWRYFMEAFVYVKEWVFIFLSNARGIFLSLTDHFKTTRGVQCCLIPFVYGKGRRDDIERS